VKGNIDIWLKNLYSKGVRSLNKDLIVFAFFFLLSFILWYLNELRKDIEIDLSYPVRYINPPRDRIVGNELPPKLSLGLKGPGYSIIKLKISGNRAPIIIDFSKVTYQRDREKGPMEYFILTSALIPNVSKQLRSEFQISSIKPDTLFVKFENKIEPVDQNKDMAGEADNSD
jgi:hypothetical protein